MNRVRCVACGTSEDAASASMSERGMICVRCAGRVQAADVEQMRSEERLAEIGVYRRNELFLYLVEGIRAMYVTEVPEGARAKGPDPRFALTLRAKAIGLTVARTYLETLVDVGPIHGLLGGYYDMWTLPTMPLVQAKFTHEGIGSKVAKVFRREVQTGDLAFDDLVYVRTSTPAATAAFLADQSVRDTIARIIHGDGFLTIEGIAVEGEVHWLLDDSLPRPLDLFERIAVALFQ